MKLKTIFGVICSTLLVMIVFTFIIYGAFNLLTELPTKNSSVISGNKVLCNIVYHTPNSRNVVLRLDDIQAYYLKDVQIRMINDILQKGKTASLGVIPINLLSDKELVDFLDKNKCNFEIMLHGYDNSYNEFAKISDIEARNKIREGLKILSEITNDVKTFVPPNNEYSNGTEKALKELGFNLISAGYWNSKYGFTETTYDWDKKILLNYQEVLQGCKKDLDEKGLCVVMIHPQDFTTNGKIDEVKYKEFIKLLNNLDSLNAKVINFRDLTRSVNLPD